MELIEELEEGILALTEELKTLRVDNSALRGELAEARQKLSNIESAQHVLQEKEEVIKTTNDRIDKLLYLVRSELQEKSNDI